MTVYVGVDVHRKRSQVAAVTADGQVQLNRNVVNGSEPMLRLIGGPAVGDPVAFGAALGWVRRGWMPWRLRSGLQARVSQTSGVVAFWLCAPDDSLGPRLVSR